MNKSGAADLVVLAEELLWVIARCDVENLSAHRGAVLEQLRQVEAECAARKISDIYQTAVEHATALALED